MGAAASSPRVGSAVTCPSQFRSGAWCSSGSHFRPTPRCSTYGPSFAPDKASTMNSSLSRLLMRNAFRSWNSARGWGVVLQPKAKNSSKRRIGPPHYSEGLLNERLTVVPKMEHIFGVFPETRARFFILSLMHSEQVETAQSRADSRAHNGNYSRMEKYPASC